MVENVKHDDSIHHQAQSPSPSPSTLLQKIRALDRKDLKPNYIPFVLGSINDEGASATLGGVVVGNAETSFVHSTLLECRDGDGSSVFELIEVETKGGGGERCSEGNSSVPTRTVLRLCVDAVYYRHNDTKSTNTTDTNDDRVEQIHVSTSRRTTALHHLTLHLLSLRIIPRIHSDVYPVSSKPIYNGGTALTYINRSTAPYLGVLSIGIHLHCYVAASLDNKENEFENENGRHNNKGGRTCNISGVWLSRRSATKSHHPNLWDSTAAGGQPYDRSLFDNVMKEAYEEAGVPEGWIRDAYHYHGNGNGNGSSNDNHPNGDNKNHNGDSDTAGEPLPPPPVTITTAHPDGSCMKPSVYYSYDLCVPPEWTPTAVDGEVECFELLSMEELKEEMARNKSRLRPAMSAVLLDFMMRHRVVTKENEVDFEELKRVLYGGSGDGPIGGSEKDDDGGMYRMWR